MEINEDTLRRFGSKIGNACLVLNGADKCLEHQVKLLRLSEFPITVRAISALKFIGSPSQMTFFTFGKWIGETLNMAAGLPGFGVHEDATINPDNIIAFLNN